jgi:hypothetical protein
VGAGDGTSTNMPAFMRMDMQNLHRTVERLGEHIDQTRSGTAANGSNETIEQLADAVTNLVTQMREEQKMVRQWIQNQQVQQNEIQRVLIRQNGTTRGRE